MKMPDCRFQECHEQKQQIDARQWLTPQTNVSRAEFKESSKVDYRFLSLGAHIAPQREQGGENE